MKELIGTTLLLIILCSCSVTKPAVEACNELRSGRYVYNMYNNSGLAHWAKLAYFITRSDSLEMVTSPHFPQDTSIYKITWTGACEYRLLLLNPRMDLDSALIRQYPAGINHKIVKTTDGYFIVKKHERKDTIWKVSN
jgi:hypothetical protein